MTISALVCVSLLLMGIGGVGMVIRRNILIMMMCLELMLTAANIMIVTAGAVHGVLGTQVLVFFVMMVAAAEVAVGLALLVLVYRLRNTISTKELTWLKG